jgi:hypothetical protein
MTMSYPHEFDHNRPIDRRFEPVEAGGWMPLAVILGAIVLGVMAYSFATDGDRTQTASNTPSTMQKIDPMQTPRPPAETTGSGAQR